MSALEQNISSWRSQMRAAGIHSPVPLDELEIHLRDEIERQIQSGSDEPEAFQLAAEKIGSTRELKTEFAKINRLTLMKNPRINSYLALAVVLAATAWLVFSGIMIGTEFIFPKDGLVSMRASDGATIQVQHGVPTLISEGTLSSGGEAHFALIPALVIPLAILVLFAIIGCLSLLRKQSIPALC